MSDDVLLKGPTDLQLILLPFSPSSSEEVQELCDAAERNDITTVEQLLQRPLDPNLEDHRHRTPLFTAATKGSFDVARLLLEAGADKDKGSGSFESTPLCMATMQGHVEIVRVLLEAKADTERHDTHGRCPAVMAAFYGHLEVMRLLLKAKADKDTDGGERTPLFYACWHGHVEMVRLLLEARADQNKATSDKTTPLHAAEWQDHAEIVRLLVKAPKPKICRNPTCPDPGP